MDALGQLFSSSVKAEIVRVLFIPGAVPVHLRALARQTKCSFSSVQRELKKLSDLGIVLETRDGNRTYATANSCHPFFSELMSMVRKSNGIAELLSESLCDPQVAVAFIFGSIASETEDLQSDLDVMVIGDIGLREIVKRLSGLAERIAREINPYVIPAAEFEKRLSNGDHFLSTVMRQPKKFLIGDEVELTRLAKSRLDSASPDKQE